MEESPLAVAIPTGDVTLEGELTVPAHAIGIVVFVHGSGSSRHSPRNRFVAGQLQQAQLGTLLFDLLTADEERWRGNVFDVTLLTRRLLEVTGWLRHQPEAADLPIGYFGASTGAAAALRAAAEVDPPVAAVVSRGGRPDLVAKVLHRVTAPTLLIVGGEDDAVLSLNKAVAPRLAGKWAVHVVPKASHLFEEPGTLAEVARLASDWFTEHLAQAEPA